MPSHPALFLSEALTLLSDSCLAPVGTALYFSLHPLAKVINPEDHGSNHNIWDFTKVARLADHMTLADLFPKICLQVYGEINENHVLSTSLNKNDAKTSRKQQRKGGGSGNGRMRTTGSTIGCFWMDLCQLPSYICTIHLHDLSSSFFVIYIITQVSLL